jgi:hypothetical protein
MVGVVICAWRPPGENRQKTRRRKLAITRNSSGTDSRAVAHRQTWAALSRCIDADGQLGQAGAERDDRKTDHHRPDAKAGGERGAATHQQVGSDEQPASPARMRNALHMSGDAQLWSCPVAALTPSPSPNIW